MTTAAIKPAGAASELQLVLRRVSMPDGLVLATYPQIVDLDAPWVIFSNSLMTDRRIWDAQALALSGQWNVLRYDQRGHGASELSDGNLDFLQLGDDVITLLDHFGVARATFVGLSMGVPTGLAAVSRAPERFSGLMLSDGQAKTAPDGGEQWRNRIASASIGGVSQYAKTTAVRWLADPSGSRLIDLEEMMAATTFDSFAASAAALADFDFENVLEAIHLPALLVAGEKDGKLPETMRAMAERIRGARFETIPDAGHVPCYERPDAFNAHMLAFLETLK